MAAFPTSIGDQLERSSTLSHSNYVALDIMDDGEASTRVLGDDVWVSIRCSFAYLTQADRDTLRAFLVTNRAGVITWTIDGVDYSGYFDGGHTESKAGNRYNVSFVYRAKEV